MDAHLQQGPREGLLSETRLAIRRWNHQAPLNAVLWSGGKDSMVLLHLLREEGLEPPVVFFREPWQPYRYEFHDRLIRDWGLQVLSWHPTASAFQRTGNEFELQNLYHLDGAVFTCPTGITHVVAPVQPADGPWACGVDMWHRPRQDDLKTSRPFQAFWIGHKASDRDVVLGGEAGTAVDVATRVDGALAFFPLRHWSDADIWSYILEFNVPYDRKRYGDIDPEEGHPVEWQDRRHNVDYVQACTACIDPRPGAPKIVRCPKLDADVLNCPGTVEWAEPTRTPYMVEAVQDTSGETSAEVT